MNGIIEFHRDGKGWRGKTWNGEEWVNWKGIHLTKGEAERFARVRHYRALFVD